MTLLVSFPIAIYCTDSPKIEVMELENKETCGAQWQVLYDSDRLEYCSELFAKSSRVTQT